MSKCGCDKKKKSEEKKYDSGCGCGCKHGAEKTATNNQWGK